MGAPGIKFILIGLVVMVAGYFLKGTLEDMGPGYLFYAVEVIGFGLFIFGGFQMFQSKMGSQGSANSDHIAVRNEVLLHTLARMTYADTNTKASEVKTVQKIYKKDTGITVAEAEIRVAARGDLHETRSFDKYLTSKGAKLTKEDKCFILRAMAEVVRSDGSVSPGEIEFFDMVGKCFKMTASEIAELRG